MLLAVLSAGKGKQKSRKLIATDDPDVYNSLIILALVFYRWHLIALSQSEHRTALCWQRSPVFNYIWLLTIKKIDEANARGNRPAYHYKNQDFTKITSTPMSINDLWVFSGIKSSVMRISIALASTIRCRPDFWNLDESVTAIFC